MQQTAEYLSWRSRLGDVACRIRGAERRELPRSLPPPSGRWRAWLAEGSKCAESVHAILSPHVLDITICWAKNVLVAHCKKILPLPVNLMMTK